MIWKKNSELRMKREEILGVGKIRAEEKDRME